MTLEAVPTPLPAATADAVTELARAAAESDGVNPLSEQTLLHLRGEHPGDTHVLAYAGSPGVESLAGYGYLGEDGTAELVVAPSYRRQGYGSGLLRVLLDHGGSWIRLWAHGRLPGSDELAQAAGLTVTRELYFLRRPASPLPPVTWPDGITVRTFVPGQDEDAWLAVNAAAFADHPEQGAWTRNDLVDRLHQPWFDPAGFFLAVDANDTIAGFHWTKIENNEGEVYVVGVNPTHQGKGLGRSLTLQGLHHLQETHQLPAITLYVDGTNTPAHHLYTTLNFTTAALHVQHSPQPL